MKSCSLQDHVKPPLELCFLHAGVHRRQMESCFQLVVRQNMPHAENQMELCFLHVGSHQKSVEPCFLHADNQRKSMERHYLRGRSHEACSLCMKIHSMQSQPTLSS